MSNTATELEKTISNGLVQFVEASKLSLDDKFMNYKPQTNRERVFKRLISEAIKNGLKDFYRPVLDPSFNDDMTGICYEFGKQPAVGKSYVWWVDTAKEFMQNSRLGTRYEYVAFLGVLIKKLVEKGWTVTKAWNAMCTDSKELGHYWNSDNAKRAFEDTGSREVCGFYDLANTCKILAEDKEVGGFWLAGGSYFNNSDFFTLADILHYNYCYDDQWLDQWLSVGWLVFDV